MISLKTKYASMKTQRLGKCRLGELILPVWGSTIIVFFFSLPVFGLNGYNPGFETMEHPEMLPYLFPPGTTTKQYASWDRTAGNDDGNSCWAWAKYPDPANPNNVVFMDEYGPGCVYRMHQNTLRSPANNLQMAYYFDDETTPRIRAPITNLFNGTIAPMNGVFTCTDWVNISYYPLVYQKRLRVICENFNYASVGTVYSGGYTFLSYPVGTNVTTWPGLTADSKKVRDILAAYGTTDPKDTTGNQHVTKNITIAAGSPAVLLDMTGQGSIAAIKIKLEPYNEETCLKSKIRIYWDNASVPAVDMPLACFFGASSISTGDDLWTTPVSVAWYLAQRKKNLFFGYDGTNHTFFCYWPMPYWSAAKIEVYNGSNTAISALQFDVAYRPAQAMNYPKERCGYFNAKFNVLPTEKHIYKGFVQKGRGHVVGRTWYKKGNPWAMEGDELTYFDDSRTPMIHGNGNEDDFNQGWAGGPAEKPMWGAFTFGWRDAWRLYLNDCYVFGRSISLYQEDAVRPWERLPPGSPLAQQVTYYYLSTNPSDTLTLCDSLDVGNAQSELAHNYAIDRQTWQNTYTDCYDGYMDSTTIFCNVTDDGRAFNGYSQFTLKINPDNAGVKLRRRLYIHGNGIQTSRIHVDGVAVEKPWHIVTTAMEGQCVNGPVNAQAWQDYDFEIPRNLTKGKSSITIKNEYVKSLQKSEVNEFYYWAYYYPGSTGVSLVDDSGTTTAAPLDLSDAQPKSLAIAGAFPNPFVTSMQIRFTIPVSMAADGRCPVSLQVLNLHGQLMRTLASGPVGPGYHTVKFDGLDDCRRALACGSYLCRLSAQGFQKTMMITYVP